MTTFALDDDWVEIDADTYDEEEDAYGTKLTGRVKAEFDTPMSNAYEVHYYGLFASEDYFDEYGDEESEEVLETDE